MKETSDTLISSYRIDNNQIIVTNSDNDNYNIPNTVENEKNIINTIKKQIEKNQLDIKEIKHHLSKSFLFITICVSVTGFNLYRILFSPAYQIVHVGCAIVLSGFAFHEIIKYAILNQQIINIENDEVYLNNQNVIQEYNKEKVFENGKKEKEKQDIKKDNLYPNLSNNTLTMYNQQEEIDKIKKLVKTK